MLELLRALRVGAVNLFGVAIPGFLLLFFALFGFLVPLCLTPFVMLDAPLEFAANFYESNKIILIAVFVLFAYVTGYVLRLTSPDELDEESGEEVRRDMMAKEPKEALIWPYMGKFQRDGKDYKDKFPYRNLYGYLEARGLNHLLDLVSWKHVDEQGSGKHLDEKESGKRSKTAIHQMKLDISLHAPELAAIVESNEAHIRLMSGTWIAIRRTKWLLLVGACVCAITANSCVKPHSNGTGIGAFLWAYSIVNLVTFFALLWVKRIIEKLFHYRRVNELVWIVMAAHEAKKKAASQKN